MLPTPNSYSLRIRSNNSTFVLLSIPRPPAHQAGCSGLRRVGQSTASKWAVSRYRNQRPPDESLRAANQQTNAGPTRHLSMAGQRARASKRGRARHDSMARRSDNFEQHAARRGDDPGKQINPSATMGLVTRDELKHHEREVIINALKRTNGKVSG